MDWKSELKTRGFVWSRIKESMVKQLGFGRSIEVCMLVKKLFEIKVNDKILFSNFIESKKEFIDKINELKL